MASAGGWLKLDAIIHSPRSGWMEGFRHLSTYRKRDKDQFSLPPYSELFIATDSTIGKWLVWSEKDFWRGTLLRADVQTAAAEPWL